MPHWIHQDKLIIEKSNTILFFIAVIGVCFILGLSSIQATYNSATYETGVDTRIELNNRVNLLSSDPSITIVGDPELGIQTGCTYVIKDQII
ncbi:MAG: hypothetical protein KAQ65_05990, partial [Candidatus Thorarchaeota archaeon]|nr:hypothetical protein [Candidatus Thorarchaeota archaeon]